MQQPSPERSARAAEPLGARAGRYPRAAEPPPASAPADWRRRSPASHRQARADSAPSPFSSLGRAPRCLCSSGPAKERAPSSFGCRKKTERPERRRPEGSGAASRLLQDWERARALSRAALRPGRCTQDLRPPGAGRRQLQPPGSSPDEPRARAQAKSLPRAAGRLRRRMRSPPGGDLVPPAPTPLPREAPTRPAAGEGRRGRRGAAAGEARGVRYFAQIANPEGTPEQLLHRAGAPPHPKGTRLRLNSGGAGAPVLGFAWH